LLIPASLGALARACSSFVRAWPCIARSRVFPKNSLKFVVGILMSASVVLVRGRHRSSVALRDAAILGLMAMLAAASWLGVRVPNDEGDRSATRRARSDRMNVATRMVRGLVGLSSIRHAGAGRLIVVLATVSALAQVGADRKSLAMRCSRGTLGRLLVNVTRAASGLSFVGL